VLGLSLAALIGLLVGYAVGQHHAPTRTDRPPAPTATPRLSSSRPVTGPPVAQTGATCSLQQGHRLELGIQIENQSASVVHITGVRTRAPLPGLHTVAARVATCGESSGSPVSSDPSAMTAGATTWLTATVQVLVRCPAADPVQFVIRYGQGDHASTETLGGFVDLGHVPYTGCPPAS
jgi:hypothetical protein